MDLCPRLLIEGMPGYSHVQFAWESSGPSIAIHSVLKYSGGGVDYVTGVAQFNKTMLDSEEKAERSSMVDRYGRASIVTKGKQAKPEYDY